MIGQDEVRKIALLARLQLDEAEEQQFTGQLGDILDYFEQLNTLDVENVEPTTRAIDVSNVTRADQLTPYAERDTILAGAPEQEGDFFRVPQIMASE